MLFAIDKNTLYKKTFTKIEERQKIKDLEKALKRVTMERDILKKAITYFCQALCSNVAMILIDAVDLLLPAWKSSFARWIVKSIQYHDA